MIIEGERVRVQLDLEDNVWFYGTVLSKPVATGDAWLIRGEYDGAMHYVQTYCQIVACPAITPSTNRGGRDA